MYRTEGLLNDDGKEGKEGKEGRMAKCKQALVQEIIVCGSRDQLIKGRM